MAFVLEDGTGLSNANTYVSVVEADSYISDYLRNSSTWTNLGSASKQLSLVEATQSIDLMYQERWIGYRKTENQALDFPRAGATDRDGYYIDATSLPIELKRATVEMAWKHVNDSGPSILTGDSTGIVPDIANPGRIAEENLKAGSVQSKTTYVAGRSDIKWFRKIELILKPYLRAKGAIERG